MTDAELHDAIVADATASGHNTSGTIGAKINSAATSGDPWGTALPGSYAAGTAGAILGAVPSGVKVASYATGQDPATLILAAVVVNTTTLQVVLRDMAAVLCGDLTENATHGSSSFSDIGDPNTPRVTSTNTATGREVILY